MAQDLPPFVEGIRKAGPDGSDDHDGDPVRTADPVARPTLETAAALGIPFFKPGYYRYAFVDARKERDAAAERFAPSRR